MINESSEKSLMILLIRFGRLMKNRIREQLEDEDQKLVGPHMGVLVDLYHKDGVRQQDLAMSSIKDKATIARALQSLEKEDFVLRTPDPVDKRTKRIYITSKGRKACQRVFPKGAKVLAKAKEGLSEEELSNCTKSLQIMYNNLNK